MTEHQRDTAFLRRLIHLEDTDERRRLDKGIGLVQRDQRCIQRAMFLLSLFAALGALVFAYGVVLEENFPHGRYYLFVRIVGEVGLALLVSNLALLILWTIYRSKLNRLREECRHLVETHLLSRFENSRTTPMSSRREPGGDVLEGDGSSVSIHSSPPVLQQPAKIPPTGQLIKIDPAHAPRSNQSFQSTD